MYIYSVFWVTKKIILLPNGQNATFPKMQRSHFWAVETRRWQYAADKNGVSGRCSPAIKRATWDVGKATTTTPFSLGGLRVTFSNKNLMNLCSYTFSRNIHFTLDIFFNHKILLTLWKLHDFDFFMRISS